jgi:hypothetical protein
MIVQDATKHYVTVSGEYIGGFCGTEPPTGAIEVPAALRTPVRSGMGTFEANSLRPELWY